MTRVLVVEDDPAAAELLAVVLQRDGHDVRVVSTAAEAELVVPQGVQLVVLDLGLPDRDGLAACRDLRRGRPALPIIVVSARASEADIVVTLDAGADDYLVKPFRSRELLARIRALLRRTNAGDLLFVGDVIIDPAAFRVTTERGALLLTPKEFEILTLLARNVGRVVPRDEVLGSLWDTPLPANSKSLDMHMSTLRRKLLDAGCATAVRTVRGVGFELEV